MPRRPSPTLADSELRLMQILWERGSSSVADVAASLPRETPLAFNSVQTTLRILEKKGYVRHTEQGRAFVYHAIVDKEEASKSAVLHVLDRFFGGAAGELALNLVRNIDLDAEARREIMRLLQEHEDDE